MDCVYRRGEDLCAIRTLEATTSIPTCGSLCAHSERMIINTPAMHRKLPIDRREHPKNAICGKVANHTLNGNTDYTMTIWIGIVVVISLTDCDSRIYGEGDIMSCDLMLQIAFWVHGLDVIENKIAFE